jgi:hypothetical protein
MVTLPPFLENVQVKYAHIPAELDSPTHCGVLWQASIGRFQLEVPGVARYLIEDGCRVTINALPGVAATRVDHFFRMTPLAALLFQRGMLAFHAAAVTTPKGAILLAGDSGSGKSALLAELLLRGSRFIADELVVIDADSRSEVICYPSYPEYSLWADTVSRLQLETGQLSDLFNDKQKIIPPNSVSTLPQHLQAIYWLSVFSKEQAELSVLEGISRFKAIGYMLYNSNIADALLSRTSYMTAAGSVAQSIPVYSLYRPRGKWSLTEMADLITGNDLEK